MTLTRAAVLEAPRRLGVVTRARPAPGSGEVLVRVAATAICHTDLEIYTGRHPGVRLPRVMGHEATGIVETVGADVARVAAGERVVINPIIACGACDCCARGDENLCRRAGLLGRELDGSLAEHLCLPARYVHALPAHLELGAATLIETLATVRHGQRRVGVAPDDAVVVLGAGATGLLHVQLARLAGARPVIALSRSGWKLDLARRMKADHVVRAGGGEAVAEVLRVTDGRGADVVIDSAGDPGLLLPALDMLRPGGRLLAYAISHTPVEGFTTFPLYLKELTLYGSRALRPDDLDEAIRLVASGAIAVDRFITASYPLDRVAAAFADYERDPGRVLRMLVVQA
jgi:2-desacetyl-2-hydroxyethyl bacteriochlorophyllide A dehydrogenase